MAEVVAALPCFPEEQEIYPIQVQVQQDLKETPAEPDIPVVTAAKELAAVAEELMQLELQPQAEPQELEVQVAQVRSEAQQLPVEVAAEAVIKSAVELRVEPVAEVMDLQEAPYQEALI